MSDVSLTPRSNPTMPEMIPEMVWGIPTHPNRFQVLAGLEDPQEDTYAVSRSQIKKQRLQAEKALSSTTTTTTVARKGKVNA